MFRVGSDLLKQHETATGMAKPELTGIPFTIKMIQEALFQQEKIIEDLGLKLSPIRRPTPNAESVGDKDCNDSSELDQSLRACLNYVHAHNRKIDLLMREVDL